MSSSESRAALDLPRPTKSIFRAMRDAGVSSARPLRNTPWIEVADDGLVVFKLVARHVKLRDGQFVARIDPRRWAEDYGFTARKSHAVVEELSRQVGAYIRIVIVDRESRPTRARYDDQPWLVTEKNDDFVLWRRREEPDGPGTPEEFTQRMLRIYTDGRDQIGYTAHRFREKVNRDGGVTAAKYWLRRGSSATEGFIRLLDHGRLDLSMEAVVLERRWAHLFTQAELTVARNRLQEVAYSAGPGRRVKRPIAAYPDEIDPGATFDEGARRTVQINAYERDENARASCISHYGARCYVCTFDFAKAYGDLGEGYIHVHHLIPVASGGRVKTNPIVHLRPVCPNCHAMLHREEPPVPIARLRRLLKRPAGHE